MIIIKETLFKGNLMNISKHFKLLGFIALFILSSFAFSKPFDQAPKSLAAWKNWVLKDVEDYECPSSWMNFNDRVCDWPQSLKIKVLKDRVEFALLWQVYSPTEVQLPGSSQGLWPTEVRTGKGKKLIVLEKNGRPVTTLAPGLTVISGRLNWKEKPNFITLPGEVVLVSVIDGGRSIPFPEFDEQNRLILKRKRQRTSVSPNKEGLELRVYRKFEDSIPGRMEVYLQMEVGGPAREVEFANPFDQSFIPMQLSSSLDGVRLTKKGSIKARVRPGSWFIAITGRSTSPLKELAFKDLPKPYPSQEVWVFKARNDFRIVEVAGAEQIDSARANLPNHFRGLPSYLMAKGKKLTITEKSRGISFLGDNNLSLEREMWLDFSGEGFTIKDKVSGKMTKHWRLDMAAPYVLGSAKVLGKGQVITEGASVGDRGLEIRQQSLSLESQARLPRHELGKAGLGWRQNFDKASGRIHLPPGHKALWLGGVDHVSGTWFSQWSLLSIFLVLLLSIGVTKIKGIKWGAIILVSMVLLVHEEGAPTTIWVHLLIALALEKALSSKEKFSRLVRLYRLGTIFVLLTIVLPFVVSQIQTAIYPSLERQAGRGQFYSSLGQYQSYSKSSRSRGRSARKKAKMMESETVSELGPFDNMAVQSDFAGAAPSPAKGRPSSALQVNENRFASYNEYDPNATIQTGPGLPNWQWGTLHFHWDGPVSHKQSLKLLVASPLLNRALVLLRIIFLGLLMFCLMDWKSLVASSHLKFLEELLPKKGTMNSFIVLLSVALGSSLIGPGNLKAQDFPPKELLKEYRSSLLKAPPCSPRCGTIEKVFIQMNQTKMRMSLDIHMGDDGFIGLPGEAKQWLPREVLVDGKKGFLRYYQDKIIISLTKGVHRVFLEGPVAPVTQLQLNFPVDPFEFKFQSSKWSVEGLDRKGKVKGTVTLTRVASVQVDKTKKSADRETAELPPFLMVEKNFNFGVRWTVTTTIRRMSPAQEAVNLKIKKLVGESVLSSQVIEEDEHIRVNLNKGQRYLSYESRLEPREELTLTAHGQRQLWYETWTFNPGPIWTVELQTNSKEFNPIRTTDNGRYAPVYRPWYGESIKVKAYKPQGAPGKTMSLTASHLTMMPGKRLSRYKLELEFLTSKGKTHQVKLPEGASLDEVKVNQQVQPLRLKEGVLNLPLGVGKIKVLITWHQETGLETLYKAPSIDVGISGVNYKMTLSLPDKRWVLALGGPSMGPAVLFWGKLLTLLLIAFFLGRLSWCPLNSLHWGVLLIGLTQGSGPALYWVAGTLLFLSARKKWLLQAKPFSYNLQSIAAIFLSLGSVALLLQVLKQGLLGGPMMDIVGNQSNSRTLNWFVDRHGSGLSDVWLLNGPEWFYQVLMLLWAIWMSLTFVKWVPWIWTGLYGEGFYKPIELSWKKRASNLKGEEKKND